MLAAMTLADRPIAILLFVIRAHQIIVIAIQSNKFNYCYIPLFTIWNINIVIHLFI